MTDEELIKLSRENLRKSRQGSLCECYDEAFIKGYRLSEKRIKELEAQVEKMKWHKVADGDLPKEGVEVLNKDGDKVIYDAGGSQGWMAYSEYCGRYVEVDEPVAWCEIPKYIEK